MIALVTGASGYIGHHVCRELLAAGHTVHALARTGSDLRGLPVSRHDTDFSFESLRAIIAVTRPDVVFHLAALARAEHGPAEIGAMIASNITLGANLVEAMLACGVRTMVNTSTYWAYGEHAERRPNTLYAATKLAFEDVLAYAAAYRGLRAASLVLFDVYGPHDWRHKLLTKVAGAPGGARISLSSGEQLMDFVHVRDVSHGFVLAAHLVSRQSEPGLATYALDTGDRRPLREVLTRLNELRRQPVALDFGAHPYPPFQIMRPATGLTRLPGWAARTSIDAGLAELAAPSTSAT
ncbi:MAG: NAD-dependent epimerase/dehydratase family protein [Planctomycetes bacterium]|nr:NAD-dependent epimerase/dehydratase family protein [Planctomycetota bacterium]